MLFRTTPLTELRIDHVHLLFLPAYSPVLQPAGRLWALTNTALATCHFATIDDLEEAHAERRVALPARPDLIRSTTLFLWWSQRVMKRQGPGLKQYHSSEGVAFGRICCRFPSGDHWR